MITTSEIQRLGFAEAVKRHLQRDLLSPLNRYPKSVRERIKNVFDNRFAKTAAITEMIDVFESQWQKGKIPVEIIEQKRKEYTRDLWGKPIDCFAKTLESVYELQQNTKTSKHDTSTSSIPSVAEYVFSEEKSI